ncbi:hypothetical protein M073_0555 [Bacteroides fragilis str. DS-71]|nr:hypothetical protein M073_0555 [Bacteroides fragilis str. DS-71]
MSFFDATICVFTAKLLHIVCSATAKDAQKFCSGRLLKTNNILLG